MTLKTLPAPPPPKSRAVPSDRDKQVQELSAEQHLADLRSINLRLLGLQGDLDRQVAQLRMDGVTWARIGEAMGISAQAAHQRWSPEGLEKHRARQRRLNGVDTQAVPAE